MKFLAIKPGERRVDLIDAADLNAALPRIGLQSGKVDHGVVLRDADGGLSIVVDELGMFVPANEQVYFGIGTRLYAGNAMIYRVDESGNAVDFEYGRPPLPLMWFENVEDVALEIATGGIERPEMRINGELIWQWPAPRPAGMGGP